MAGENKRAAAFEHLFILRQRGDDSLVAGDIAVFIERHVKIHPHKYLFAFYVYVGYRFLGHIFTCFTAEIEAPEFIKINLVSAVYRDLCGEFIQCLTEFCHFFHYINGAVRIAPLVVIPAYRFNGFALYHCEQ